MSGVDYDRLAERITPDELAEALGSDRAPSGWRCPLPDRHSNADAEPSFSPHRRDGRTWAKCHGCGLQGTPVQVAAEVWGVQEPEAARRLARRVGMTPTGPSRRIEDIYDYVDEDGDLIFQVVRFVPKTFRQRRPDGQGGWEWSTRGVRRVLYRLPRVLEAVEAGEPIYLVEGEKDVHAVEDAGGVATTNPGGAGKWRDEYTEALEGGRVGIVADRDEAGREHAWTVARRLEGVARKVAVLEPAVEEDGADVSDHLAAGHALSDLVVVDGPPADPAEDRPETVTDLLEAAGPLPEDAELEGVEGWLGHVVSSLDGAGPRRRALVREAVVDRLRGVEAVGSPARLADAYLTAGGSDAGDDLHGSAVLLEDPEPWPEAVDGEALLGEMARTFARFLALPDGAATALVLWTVHAHAHDASPVSPVLAITSPEKRCGKTTLLELLSALVPRPLPASNLTAATVFRAVEQWRPTLLVDEADTFLREGTELRGVLNSGHRRSMAYVVRTVGDDHEPRQFRTWAPKAVALIGELPDTLGDRSVEVRMRRRAPEEDVERLRLDRLEDLEPLRRRAWTWARERMDRLETADPAMPDGLHDRARDNWRPLLAIADAAGGPWPDRARKAARVVSGDGRGDHSLGTRLLEDIRGILEDHPSDRIRSKALVDKLTDLEEAPWAEYKGRGLSPVSLANFLRSFDVSSKKIRFASGPYKGYEVAAFKDAFRRYLPPPPSEAPPAKAEHPEQSSNGGDSDGFSRRNTGPGVPGRESDENPGETRDVPGVPGREGNPAEGHPQEPASADREAF